MLDASGDSGSTLIAARKTGRRERLIEYEPNSGAGTIHRWQKIARGKAVLGSDGRGVRRTSRA